MKIKRIDEFNLSNISENKLHSVKLANDIVNHYNSSVLDITMQQHKDRVVLVFTGIPNKRNDDITIKYHLVDITQRNGDNYIWIEPFVVVNNKTENIKPYKFYSLKNTIEHIDAMIRLAFNGMPKRKFRGFPYE